MLERRQRMSGNDFFNALTDLRQRRGAIFLTVRAKIIPEMRKKNNPFLNRVHKITLYNGVIGADYETAVNRQLERQNLTPDFEAGEHQWAVYLNECFVQHPTTGRRYIKIHVQSRREYWFLDNLPMTDAQLEADKAFLPEKKPELVMYRNIAVDNILSVKYRQVVHYLNQRWAKKPA